MILDIDQVIDCIVRNEKLSYQVAETRRQALHEIRGIFQETLTEPVNDDQAHLRRIMADAEAHTSKYDLLLSELAVPTLGHKKLELRVHWKNMANNQVL
ncbi:hypothetical protein BKA82DRAFT_414826 [Pisolithus tinctorius]|uniref:Uncharacterized protein n=1 Tax=Pisolithus tinctorius Marx 270 TaxID=870435 RepID=A0A0C3NDZ3_PISTI|nr:hypothetical protein BKA82DRAFT_414826 [Pisolithus tinctorius]KIN94005.1 hypothetical protein M404DRAFT_414826 [Pisolithus tinctorius Marx 270]